MQSAVFYKSLQDACVIFHDAQQFLFIQNKGVDPLALGRVKGGGRAGVNLMTRHVPTEPHMVFSKNTMCTKQLAALLTHDIVFVPRLIFFDTNTSLKLISKQQAQKKKKSSTMKIISGLIPKECWTDK